jgi:gamma-glutamyl-gamma-aminobutyrate hydrolase PuuD
MQNKNQSQKAQSTQTRVLSKVFQEAEEFRVESWSRQDVEELAQEMNWNFNQKGTQYE